jgi:hypothetical protein
MRALNLFLISLDGVFELTVVVAGQGLRHHRIAERIVVAPDHHDRICSQQQHAGIMALPPTYIEKGRLGNVADGELKSSVGVGFAQGKRLHLADHGAIRHKKADGILGTGFEFADEGNGLGGL